MDRAERDRDAVRSALVMPRGQQPAGRDDVVIDREVLRRLSASKAVLASAGPTCSCGEVVLIVKSGGVEHSRRICRAFPEEARRV